MTLRRYTLLVQPGQEETAMRLAGLFLSDHPANHRASSATAQRHGVVFRTGPGAVFAAYGDDKHVRVTQEPADG